MTTDWQPIETAPKDGQFRLFDSPYWSHPRVLRWAKVKLSAHRAFVSEYGVAPSYLPAVWRPLPERLYAGRMSETEARSAFTSSNSTHPAGRSTVVYGKETVRVVILRDQIGTLVQYVAQGLERDIAAQGDTPEHAMRRLASVAKFDADEARRRGVEVPAAPQHVHDFYSQAPAR